MLQYLEEKGIVFGDRPVMYEIAIDDDPAEMIIESSQDNEIDLIVMATHDRSGLGKLLKGSVADEVIESGVAPVLLVHPTGETEMLPAGSDR
jgi:nucleotide-binding universal stress UspA family protein